MDGRGVAGLRKLVRSIGSTLARRFCKWAVLELENLRRQRPVVQEKCGSR